jgi:hypothetical protein
MALSICHDARATSAIDDHLRRPKKELANSGPSGLGHHCAAPRPKTRDALSITPELRVAFGQTLARAVAFLANS